MVVPAFDSYSQMPKAGFRVVKYDPNESRRAKEIPSEVWDSHRDVIVQLWVIENQNLHQLMDTMNQEHGFVARYVDQ